MGVENFSSELKEPELAAVSRPTEMMTMPKVTAGPIFGAMLVTRDGNRQLRVVKESGQIIEILYDPIFHFPLGSERPVETGRAQIKLKVFPIAPHSGVTTQKLMEGKSEIVMAYATQIMDSIEAEAIPRPREVAYFDTAKFDLSDGKVFLSPTVQGLQQEKGPQDQKLTPISANPDRQADHHPILDPVEAEVSGNVDDARGDQEEVTTSHVISGGRSYRLPRPIRWRLFRLLNLGAVKRRDLLIAGGGVAPIFVLLISGVAFTLHSHREHSASHSSLTPAGAVSGISDFTSLSPAEAAKADHDIYGIPDVLAANIWALNGGKIPLPMPGGGTLTQPGQFAAFGSHT